MILVESIPFLISMSRGLGRGSNQGIHQEPNYKLSFSFGIKKVMIEYLSYASCNANSILGRGSELGIEKPAISVDYQVSWKLIEYLNYGSCRMWSLFHSISFW